MTVATMNKDDALRLALEALEEIADEVLSPYDNKLGGAILAIREALEQPAPYRAVKTYHDGKPVYVQEPPKREWQGLTDEEINELWDEMVKYAPSEVRIKDFARAIEAKLMEKNA